MSTAFKTKVWIPSWKHFLDLVSIQNYFTKLQKHGSRMPNSPLRYDWTIPLRTTRKAQQAVLNIQTGTKIYQGTFTIADLINIMRHNVLLSDMVAIVLTWIHSTLCIHWGRTVDKSLSSQAFCEVVWSHFRKGNC